MDEEESTIDREIFRRVVAKLQCDGPEELDIRDVYEEFMADPQIGEFDSSDDEIVEFFKKQAEEYYRPTQKEVKSEVYYLKQVVNLLIFYISQICEGLEGTTHEYDRKLNKIVKILRNMDRNGGKFQGITLDDDDDDDEPDDDAAPATTPDDEHRKKDDEERAGRGKVETPPVELSYVS